MTEFQGSDVEKPDDRMEKWFAFAHLPGDLQHTSREFWGTMNYLIEHLDPGPERTVALRKLLESKDAAVRATLHPGG